MIESETQGMERIRNSNYVLNFVTHEARNMMEALQFFDLRVYDQVKLIELGDNWNPNTVLQVLMKKPSKKRMEENPDGSFPIQHEDCRSHRDIIEGFRKSPKMVQRRHVQFNPQAIDNLMFIDQHILYADYNTPVEAILFVLSDPLNTEDMILDVASDGRNNMGLTIFKLQERIEAKRREDADLVKSFEPPEVPVGKPMTKESVKAFAELNKELTEIMKINKGYEET